MIIIRKEKTIAMNSNPAVKYLNLWFSGNFTGQGDVEMRGGERICIKTLGFSV